MFCGSSSVVEHDLAMVGVAGSNPVFRSKIKDSPLVGLFLREIAQLGRALRSGRRGRRFKSGFPDSDEKEELSPLFLLLEINAYKKLANLLD